MNRIVTLAIILLIPGGSLLSQTPETIRQKERDIIASTFGMDKKSIVTKYMKFSSEEAEAFWPVYTQFARASQDLAYRRVEIMLDYIDNYQDLSDMKAEELALGLAQNNIDWSKLQKQYFKHFKKAIGAKRAAQFLQLDYYIQTTIRAELQDALPFIKG